MKVQITRDENDVQGDWELCVWPSSVKLEKNSAAWNDASGERVLALGQMWPELFVALAGKAFPRGSKGTYEITIRKVQDD